MVYVSKVMNLQRIGMLSTSSQVPDYSQSWSAIYAEVVKNVQMVIIISPYEKLKCISMVKAMKRSNNHPHKMNAIHPEVTQPDGSDPANIMEMMKLLQSILLCPAHVMPDLP